MRDRFPHIDLDLFDKDANPAVRLFGRRFFSDQTTLELLVELLLVAVSPKKVGGRKFSNMLPPLDLLKDPWTDTLDYAPAFMAQYSGRNYISAGYILFISTVT